MHTWRKLLLFFVVLSCVCSLPVGEKDSSNTPFSDEDLIKKFGSEGPAAIKKIHEIVADMVGRFKEEFGVIFDFLSNFPESLEHKTTTTPPTASAPLPTHPTPSGIRVIPLITR